MKKLLQSEEALIFAACLYVYSYFDLSWWWFVGCLLLPDVSMLGYAFNSRVGAYSYNFFHHRGLAVVIGIVGIIMGSLWIQFCGFILFSHASMDRMLGYGLKFEKGFKFTHLGQIGHDEPAQTQIIP